MDGSMESLDIKRGRLTELQAVFDLLRDRISLLMEEIERDINDEHQAVQRIVRNIGHTTPDGIVVDFPSREEDQRNHADELALDADIMIGDDSY